MSNFIENFLKENGFKDKDIQIYLDIYRHGQSFASSVALRTGIDRTTVYSVIKRLLKRGFVMQTKVNDVSLYMVEDPKIFSQKIDNKIETLKSVRRTSLLFAEEIEKLSRSKFSKPNVRVYEGEEAMINLYKQTLEKGGTQKAFSNIQTLPKGMKDFLKKEFMELKLKKNVFSKVIIPNNKFSEKYKSKDKSSNRETKIVEKHPFDLHSEIILFNKKEIAVVDFHKQIYGFVIESETFYRTIEALFDYVWLTIS